MSRSIHTFSDDEESDATVDTSLRSEASSTSKSSPPQSKSQHTTSDTDSDVTVDTSVAKDTRKISRSIAKYHNVSDSDSDVIPDTDSENGNLNGREATKRLSIGKNKPRNEAPKRTAEKELFGTDSENDDAKSQTIAKHKKSKLSPNDHKSKLKKELSGQSLKAVSPQKKTTSIYDVSTDDMSSEEEKPPRKQHCPYGLKCYRKNPSHFAEFSHPSDSGSASKVSHGSSHSSSSSSSSFSNGSATATSTSNTSYSSPDKSSLGSRLSVHASGYDIVDSVRPLNLMLTKVTGIANQHNCFASIGIRDILSPSMGKLHRSAQFNYCIDVDWVVAQYPKEYKSCPLLIVHGSQREQKADLDIAASKYDHVRMCAARMDIPYGTHHTKMMLLVYDRGMRVVIHTANLVERDWYQKTQGVWVSPLYRRMDPKSKTSGGGDSATNFRRDLVEYLSAYKARQLEEWVNIIQQHDMSETKVFLIGSIPGRHTGDKKRSFGHLKLRKVLQHHGPSSASKSDILVGQFSSVGSMGPNKEGWLCSEWRESLAATKVPAVAMEQKPQLKLIFPARENIRLSLEGYPAGQSVPYSANVAKKQIFLHQFFHQWKSELRGRSRASPHIKTFLRASPDSSHLHWLLITSCNLSKAAWGAYEKSQSQLMIRSYELGVLFLPHMFNPGSSTFRVATAKDIANGGSTDGNVVTLPFDLPVTPYGPKDQPWIWDIAYTKLPDSHGNMWCPR